MEKYYQIIKSLPLAFCAIFICSSLQVQGQSNNIKIGIGAGINRQFLNSFNYADFGENESIQGSDNFGYIFSLYIQKSIKNNTSVYISPHFSYNKFNIVLSQVIPDYAEVAYSWESRQYSFATGLGISQIVLNKNNKKLYFKLGITGVLDNPNIYFDDVAFSFSSNKYNSIYTSIDPTITNKPILTPGFEIGSGLRLYDGVDIAINYNRNFSQSNIISYKSEIGSQLGANDVRYTNGKLNTRNSYISFEIIFWLNKNR